MGDSPLIIFPHVKAALQHVLFITCCSLSNSNGNIVIKIKWLQQGYNLSMIDNMLAVCGHVAWPGSDAPQQIHWRRTREGMAAIYIILYSYIWLLLTCSYKHFNVQIELGKAMLW